jgi:hypothetical protein
MALPHHLLSLDNSLSNKMIGEGTSLLAFRLSLSRYPLLPDS